MSIASRIDSIENNIGKAYDELGGIGIETDVNKNIANISAVISNYYDSLPKVSGTGTSISLSPTKVGKIKSTIIGNTIQDGTPTPDSPVEIQKVTGEQNVSVDGKNLFDKDNVNILNANLNNNMINSASAEITIWIKCKPNTTYSFTKLVNSPYTRNIIVETTTTPAIGVSVQNKSSHGSSETFSYTTSSTAQYIVWWCYNTSSTNYTFQEILDSIQIEYGSSVTEYEPYQGKDYEINLGKNLWGGFPSNVNRIHSGITFVNNEDGTISASGIATANAYSVTLDGITDNNHYILLQQGTYMLSGSLNNKQRLQVYDISGTNIATDSGTGVSFTLTEPTQVYVRLLINSGENIEDGILVKPMIEKGSQATPYSPYFTPIHLYEGDQITGTPDNWSIKHNKVKDIFDENSDLYFNGSASTPTERSTFRITTSDNAGALTYVSNRFIYGSTTSNRIVLVVNNNKPYLSIDNTIAGINTSDTNAEKEAKIKTWLGNNNVELVYELATPTTEPITNTELISQLNAFYYAKSYNGQTNISVEGDLPMILDVSALKGE